MAYWIQNQYHGAYASEANGKDCVDENRRKNRIETDQAGDCHIKTEAMVKRCSLQRAKPNTWRVVAEPGRKSEFPGQQEISSQVFQISLLPPETHDLKSRPVPQ
jgi:hypothetical protein